MFAGKVRVAAAMKAAGKALEAQAIFESKVESSFKFPPGFPPGFPSRFCQYIHPLQYLALNFNHGLNLDPLPGEGGGETKGK